MMGFVRIPLVDSSPISKPTIRRVYLRSNKKGTGYFMRQQRERIAGEWNSVIRGASRIRGVDNLDGSYGQRMLISGGA